MAVQETNRFIQQRQHQTGNHVAATRAGRVQTPERPQHAIARKLDADARRIRREVEHAPCHRSELQQRRRWCPRDAQLELLVAAAAYRGQPPRAPIQRA